MSSKNQLKTGKKKIRGGQFSNYVIKTGTGWFGLSSVNMIVTFSEEDANKLMDMSKAYCKLVESSTSKIYSRMISKERIYTIIEYFMQKDATALPDKEKECVEYIQDFVNKIIPLVGEGVDAKKNDKGIYYIEIDIVFTHTWRDNILKTVIPFSNLAKVFMHQEYMRVFLEDICKYIIYSTDIIKKQPEAGRLETSIEEIFKIKVFPAEEMLSILSKGINEALKDVVSGSQPVKNGGTRKRVSLTKKTTK